MYSTLTKFLSFLILGSLGFLLPAQNLVKVKDPVLAEVLCEQMAELMNPTCDSLDLDKVALVPETDIQVFNGNNRGITEADELKYITGLDTIYIRDNDLIDFPDLNNFTNLVRVDLTNNNLTVAPRINYPNNQALRVIQVTGNRVTEFPAWGETSNTTMYFVNISWNRLKTIPELDSILNMNRLRAHRNEFPFSELLKIKNHPNYEANKDIWRLFPQHDFTVMDDTELLYDQELEIVTPGATPGNSYTLVNSDNDTIAQNQTGVFTVDKAIVGDSSRFQVLVRNVDFTEEDEFLQSIPFLVKITFPEAYEDKGYLKFSPDNDGIDDFIYLEGEGEFTIHGADGGLIQEGTLPVNWSGQDTEGKYIKPGIYYMHTSTGITKILSLY